MKYLRYKPNRLWVLDTASPFADRSGYGVNATLTGSSTQGIELSAYALYSQVVNSTNYITFPQTVYKSGLEQQEFTLAASIFVPDVGTVSNQQVLSSLAITDGIWINGNTVNFTTTYTSNGTATVSYTAPFSQRLDVVGVHTRTRNMLFINGEYIDSVDITDVQQADTYAAAVNGNLYAGRLGTQNLLINMVGIFPRALHSDEIKAMWVDNSTVSTTDPIVAYVGETIPVTADSRPTFLDAGWYSAEDWATGSSQHVFVDDEGTLRPEMIGTSTMAGIWNGSVNLYYGSTPTTINSVNLYWYGKNETIQVSVDGTTWETVTKGVNITTVPAGFDPTGKALFVRVTFTGSQTEAYVSNLQIRGYTTNVVQQPNGRTITFTNPTMTFDDQVPFMLQDNWGTKSLGGAIDISTDTSSGLPMTVKTVEIWVKQLTGTAPTLSANLTTGTTIYTNGALSSTIRRGEWNVQHYVKAAGFTGNLTFTGQVQIGRVVIYGTALTATQITNVVDDYTGILFANRSSGGPLTIAEHNPPANIYAHDWATTE